MWKKDISHNFPILLFEQQSSSEPKPSELGQLFDPQNRWLLHSLLESQSPSCTSQGSSIVQKSSSPTIAE